MSSNIRITFVFLALFLFSSLASAQIIVVKKPVRPKIAIVKPTKPGKKYIWVNGHWAVRGGKYVWVKGNWAKKKPGAKWISGHWKKVPGGWKWIPGHWKVRR